jgi:hypothetical protein
MNGASTTGGFFTSSSRSGREEPVSPETRLTDKRRSRFGNSFWVTTTSRQPYRETDFVYRRRRYQGCISSRVAALDHSEVVAPEIAGNVQDFIANRVPDACFLLDYMLAGAIPCTARPDPDRIAIVGHSAGGWTALALPETDTRIQAVVALAPGGASNPKPGIIPATLSFNWPRPPATLYIVAEDDVLTPIAGMHELYSRTPRPKRMVVLLRADHLHFVDNVEQAHEQLRAASLPPEASWISREMRPIAELCTGEEAHRQIQSHTLAHLNAALSRRTAP